MVTELRVHGVSGASAESILDRPLLHPVAGDHEAGFHRPRPAYGDTTGPGGAQLEGYRWGNLTAGAAARAMWLMLLPFMLANVSMWLRPPAGRAGAMLTRALFRIFCLSITATFVLALVGISLDLVAWQCTATGSPCAVGRPVLGLLEGVPTGRRLAIVALLPMAALAFLWWLARRSWCRYEMYPIPSETADGDGLAAAGFWAGRALVGRLRAIHLAFACGTLTALLIGALATHDRGRIGYLLAAAVAGLLALCVVAIVLPGMVSRDRPAAWAEVFARTLRNASTVLLVLTLAYAFWPRAAWPTTGGLPGYGLTVTGLFAVQILLLFGLGIVVFVQQRRVGPGYLAGLAGPIVASLGLGVAVAFTAGLSYRVADFLDRSGTPSEASYLDLPTLEPPAAYEWTAFGFVVLVVVVALVALVARSTVTRRLRVGAAAVTDLDFGPDARRRDPDRARAIDNAIGDARLTDHIGAILMWAYLPLAVAATVVTGLALAGIGPVELAAAGSLGARVLSFVTNLGTYLIGFAALGLLVLGLLAYRYAGIRRIIGVAWDLGTFWPRAAHPLAPPCYAERVVPELVTRASWLAGQGGVVLSGHSQGSVLMAATALQIPPRLRDRVALITYGSPLGRLYARAFPAYVNSAVVTQIDEAVGGRWRNVWRETDPIGGPVGRAVDERLRDPEEFDIRPGDTVPPEIMGHSGYQHAVGFAGAVTALVSHLHREPVAPPV